MNLLLALGLGSLLVLWGLIDPLLRRGELPFVRPPGPRTVPAEPPILSALAPTRVEGLELGALRHRSAVTCKVCGEGIGLDRVRCAECHAPHHADCWAYAGSCAIFGCRSRRASA